MIGIDTFKTPLFFILWVFMVFLVYVIGNTILGGYFVPIMNGVANSANNTMTAPGLTSTDYINKGNVLMLYFQAGCFILLLIPFLYLFVRMLMKREPANTQPSYNPYSGGNW